MKRTMWLLTFSSVWGQQANVSTRTFDLNGHAVQGVGTIQSGPTRSQVTRDLNGRTVPVESVEERVVSDAGGVRTTERIVKRYDPNGNPGPAERVRIEERKQPDGSISTAATIERGDINGAFQLAERSTTLTRTAGTRTESTTTVERPTLNGSMEVIERRDQAINTESNKTTERASTLRRDANGRLTEFAKKDREAISSNGQTNENVVEYESATTGQMRLMRQTAAILQPNGIRQVTVYLPNAQGVLKVSEQKVIERKNTPTGTTETTTVQFPLPSDSGKLGTARMVEQTVCNGACGQPSRP